MSTKATQKRNAKRELSAAAAVLTRLEKEARAAGDGAQARGFKISRELAAEKFNRTWGR